jgi:hypothetical protein
MDFRRRLGLLGTALVASSLAVTAAPGAALAAPAPAVTTLPISVSSGADLVAAGDREFVSGGRDGSQIAVADAAGAIVGTIDGLPGPTDLALTNDRRTLYVALPAINAVAAFDTGSLNEAARYDLGAGATCLSTVAPAGRYLWFGYGCAAAGNIGKVDLGRQPARVTLGQADAAQFYAAPILASAPRNASVLVAGEAGLSPSEVHSFTVTAGALTQVATSRDLSENLRDLALDPAGTTVFAASGAPYYFPSATVGTLAETAEYQADAYPNAVDVSRDGTRLVGGIDGYYEPDLYFYRVGATTPVSSVELGALLLPHALAWAPNGRRVYAVTGNVDVTADNAAQLHVVPAPAT